MLLQLAIMQRHLPEHFAMLHDFASGIGERPPGDTAGGFLLENSSQDLQDQFINIIRCATQHTPDGLVLVDPFATDPATRSLLEKYDRDLGWTLKELSRFWQGGFHGPDRTR
jgi:hypothetical protein